MFTHRQQGKLCSARSVVVVPKRGMYIALKCINIQTNLKLSEFRAYASIDISLSIAFRRRPTQALELRIELRIELKNPAIPRKSYAND